MEVDCFSILIREGKIRKAFAYRGARGKLMGGRISPRGKVDGCHGYRDAQVVGFFAGGHSFVSAANLCGLSRRIRRKAHTQRNKCRSDQDRHQTVMAGSSCHPCIHCEVTSPLVLPSKPNYGSIIVRQSRLECRFTLIATLTRPDAFVQHESPTDNYCKPWASWKL